MWDPNGIPEFVRARKAMQYSSSIDDYVLIMKEGNNGGYANNWLVGDRKVLDYIRHFAPSYLFAASAAPFSVSRASNAPRGGSAMSVENQRWA